MPNSHAVKNTILASPSGEEFARLRMAVVPVSLKFGQVLYEPGKSDPACLLPYRLPDAL
jgi:hypothetical protein